ncbi:MAG: DUF6878 family protein [Novosphingobium sp.]
MTETQDWMVKFYAEQAARKAAASAMFERNKAAIIPALAAIGIVSAELDYDGMGDSGCVEHPSYFGCDGSPLDDPDVQIELEEFQNGSSALVPTVKSISTALTDFAYETLELHHPGWEINEGAFGTFRIEVANNRMVLCCSVRTAEYFEDEIAGEG